jgi:cystathionine gamma-synthase
MRQKPKFETLAIKSIELDLGPIEPVSTPIYLSSTFKRNEDGTFQDDFIYSRNDNPNRKALEISMAQLEQGKFAYAFSSGMAAINAVFQSLKPGDHVLLPDDIYYAIRKLMNEVFQRWDLSYTLVDMSDPEVVANAITETTRLIWIETPSNPLLKITDIEAIVKLASTTDILVVADNTWSTPVIQNPLTMGVDIVVHSTTKYLGGHSDVVGGCIVLNNSEIANKIKAIQLLSGAVPSPFDCWLIARGIQTLHLRISKQCENAVAVAQYLDCHAKVEKVHYPGLKSHTNHMVALRQQKGIFGGMLSVQLKTDADCCRKVGHNLKYFKPATSLGGVESLVEHRRSVEGPGSSTPANLLRISVGIEHPDDLINDWEEALQIIP